MDFAFTEEQEELRENARGFLEEFSGSEQVRRAAESELGYDPELWKQLGAELGWTSVVIPEEYGGRWDATLRDVRLPARARAAPPGESA